MKLTKKVADHLTKCYSIAPMEMDGTFRFLIAAEKHDPCYLFDEDGNRLETVWEGPGGVMTMVQAPGRSDQFLATHEFYSPNDSANARVVTATRRGKNDWQIQTLADAPFVHRFGVLERNGVHYLLVCCLKSGHAYKDDWTQPGAVYAAVLPDNLDGFDKDHQLELTKLKENMCHNHGYSAYEDHGVQTGIVTCDDGVFQFIPPETACGQWEIRKLYDQPVSDAVLCDFDEDGEPELGCISPFHGDELYICKKNADGVFEKVWQHPEKPEMLHATWACQMHGRPCWIVGHRKGERNLMIISFADGAYRAEVIDRDCGTANAFHFVNSRGEDVIVAANRETDEIALYTVTE